MLMSVKGFLGWPDDFFLNSGHFQHFQVFLNFFLKLISQNFENIQKNV